MKNKLFLWPLSKPWTYSPQGYVCAVIWNISELTRVPLPKPDFFFGMIIGRCGKKSKGGCPMSNIDIQAVQAVADLKAGYTLGHADVAILNVLARIALASLEAKPIGAFHIADQQVGGTTDYIKDGEWPIDDGVIEVYAAPPAPANAEPVAWLWSHRKHPSEVTLVRHEDDERAEGANWSGWSCQALYAAPPAPVSVPDLKPVGFLFVSDDGAVAYSPADCPMKGFNLIGPIYGDVNACRAAMLHGAEPVKADCKLRDAVEIIRNAGIEIDAEKILAERDALNAPDCWCRTCRPVTMTDMRFVVCPECGNKRCPHANDHRHACTGSNEPGQEGSAYPAAPQQEVK